MKYLWLILVSWELAVNAASIEDSHKRVIRETVGDCKSPAGENGLCTNIRECPSLFEMMKQDGRDSYVISFLRKSKCAGAGKTPIVCCPDTLYAKREQEKASIETTTQPTKPSSTAPLRKEPIKCGESALNSDRIVGGKDAALGSWPWMVGLSYKIRGAQTSSLNIKCGATLIANQWVLTAAHCVTGSALKDLELSFARLGDLDLNENVDDEAKPIDGPIDKVIVHSEYSTDIKKNDIALIRLKEPVEFTKNLHSICLPSGSTYKEPTYYDRKLPYIIGWGATGWRGKATTKLQEAQIKVVEASKCAEKYAKVKGALINEKVICAGDIGKDTCQGDSGGPLIIPIGKIFHLAGVVSYGIGCNTSIPGVYTKVAEYIDWINLNTGQNF